MAVRLEFYISDEDMDRLWAIKEAKESRHKAAFFIQFLVLCLCPAVAAGRRRH